MRYQRSTIAVAAFVAGYILKSVLSPSTPSELLSALEKRITKDPIKYEQVIDQTIEFAHQAKAEANPQPVKQGYVPFKDIRLVLIEEQDGDLTVLVNKYTHEEKPIQYIDGKTAVGTYQERLESVKDEAIQQGKQLIIDAKDIAKEKTKGIGDKVKEKATEFYDWACGFFSCDKENRSTQPNGGR